jgi:hypothetical protein
MAVIKIAADFDLKDTWRKNVRRHYPGGYSMPVFDELAISIPREVCLAFELVHPAEPINATNSLSMRRTKGDEPINPGTLNPGKK